MDLTKLSDADLAALQAKDLSKISDEGLALISGATPKPEPGLLRKGFDYGMRGLDYAGGLVRGGAAGLLEAGTGKELVNIEDVLAGKAPSTSEVLGKFGASEMGSLSDVVPGMYSEGGDEWLKFKKGGALDVTGRGVVGLAGDIALDPLTYGTLGISALGKLAKANKLVGPALNPTAKAAASTGKSLWKSALGRIDEEALKYGKDPVSDLLIEKGIAGSAIDIFKQMDELGRNLLEKRQGLLKKSTKQGAEVSMKEAMAPAFVKAQELRQNPATAPLADALESMANKYVALEGKAPAPMLRELPVGGTYGGGMTPIDIKKAQEVVGELPQGQMGLSKDAISGVAEGPLQRPVPFYEVTPGEVIPGKTIPDEFIPRPAQTVYDMTEAVMGPSPLQATKYKSSLYGAIPESAYKDPNIYGTLKDAEKTLSGGMRDAIEKSVGRTSGEAAEKELKQLNKELGQILTTKERQAHQAMLEGRKPAITQTTGAVASGAFASANPSVKNALISSVLGKELVRALQFTGPRTKLGKGMKEFGESEYAAPIWDILLRQNLIDSNRSE